MKRVLLGSLVLVACGNVSGTVNSNGNTVTANVPEAVVTKGGVVCTNLNLDCPDAATDPTTEIIKDGVITTIKDPTTAFSIASASELPICCPEKEGALVFIKDSASFKTCSSNQWGDINLKGDKGSDGASVTGAKGDVGTSGSQGRSVGLSITAITDVSICATGGEKYNFYFDNDNTKTYTVGDEYFAENNICNGAVGPQGIAGTETKVSFQQICDGTFGFSNANAPNPSANLVDAQIAVPGYIHVEYTETSAGDLLFSGRIVSEGQGYDVSFNRIIPKNAPRNNTAWPIGNTGLSVYKYAFAIDRIPVTGSSKFIFYPSRIYTKIGDPFIGYEIEDSSFAINGIVDSARPNKRVTNATAAMTCTSFSN